MSRDHRHDDNPYLAVLEEIAESLGIIADALQRPQPVRGLPF